MSFFGCCCDPPPSTHTLPPCVCTTIPDTIQVHVANPPDPTIDSFVQPSTLTWQAQPADISGSTGANPGYWGPRFTTHSGSYTFRNVVVCGGGGLYILSGIITNDSVLTGAGQTVHFWSPATSGNTCSPFSMVNGGPSTGFYSTQGITLSAP